jgi:hypothetical protein
LWLATAYCNLTELIGIDYLKIAMALLLVQNKLDVGRFILLLLFTDLQVEDLKECFDIAVDVCMELMQLMLLTEHFWNCWHVNNAGS